MFDIIAEVSEYSPVGKNKNLKQLKIKRPIPQTLNIIPGQFLYPYAGPINETGRRSLYLFLHEINERQYFFTFEFKNKNVNSFIKLSKDLANSKVNIIASKYLAFSNNHTVSLIYDVKKTSWFGDDFINYIKNKYKDITVVKSFWYWNQSDPDAKLHVNLLKEDVPFLKKKVTGNFTITFRKFDFEKLEFDDPKQIKTCVQIAYPDIGAVVLHFFDDNRIKKAYFGYPNIPGSYAGTLQLLSDLKIENLFNTQKNTQMEAREGHSTDLFIFRYISDLDDILSSDENGNYEKLRRCLNKKFCENENGNYTELLKNLNEKDKKEFIKYLRDDPKKDKEIQRGQRGKHINLREK